MQRRQVGPIGLCVLISITPPAFAQQPQNAGMTQGAAWTHEQTGFQFPATLSGYERDSGTAYVPGGWDISAQYFSPTNDASISVYLYQAALADAGILIEEARRALEERTSHFVDLKPIAAVAPFAPSGTGPKSGLRLTYSSSGRYKSTAVAVAPWDNEWVIKIRISSMTATPQDLDAMLTGTIGALQWSSKSDTMPDARIPPICGSNLHIAKKPKIDEKNATANAMVGAFISGVQPALLDEATPAAQTHLYCRNAGPSSIGAIYRPEGTTDSYILSLGDSGRAIIVRPGYSVTDGASEKKRNRDDGAYSIEFVQPGERLIYTLWKGMPKPEQALQVVASSAPLVTTPRTKENNKFNILLQK